MLRTAWKVLGRWGGNDAEDVVQDAFVAALTTQALPFGDVGAWLRAITVRKALDSARKATRRAEQSLSPEQVDHHEPADPNDPDAAVDVLTVRRALKRLAPLDRAVLVLADLEGYSMAETAQVALVKTLLRGFAPQGLTAFKEAEAREMTGGAVHGPVFEVALVVEDDRSEFGVLGCKCVGFRQFQVAHASFRRRDNLYRFSTGPGRLLLPVGQRNGLDAKDQHQPEPRHRPTVHDRRPEW